MTMLNMQCTDLSLTMHSEGLRLESYPDGNGWAIGYGSHVDGCGPGQTCTQEQAQQYLQELMQDRVDMLNEILERPVNQNQFNALCDWAYNCKPDQVKGSTLIALINKDDLPGAWAQFPAWKYSGGLLSIGLWKRRRLEQAVWNGLDCERYGFKSTYLCGWRLF